MMIYYFYPMWHRVSFQVIAQKHCEQLRKYFRLFELDELALPFIEVTTRPLVILQPYFYPFQQHEKTLSRRLDKVHGLIGVDVADSDHITQYAVRLTQYADAIIVPSSFARKAYVSSGVSKPTHVIPHGVNQWWLDEPPNTPSTFQQLAKLKAESNTRILTCYIIHSEYRKGLDILLELYRHVHRERSNTILLLKTMNRVGFIRRPIDFKGGSLDMYLEPLSNSKWLTEKEQMELFDLSDIYLLTSRGGGFEHPALLALSRGLPVIGARGGAWEDYLPEWCLVDSVKSGRVLEGNPIHDGYGVEMLIDRAVEKTIDILDRLEEYKVKVKDYVNTHVRNELTWEKIGEKLRDVVQKYM